jgi:hypothetical protein
MLFPILDLAYSELAILAGSNLIISCKKSKRLYSSLSMKSKVLKLAFV